MIARKRPTNVFKKRIKWKIPQLKVVQADYNFLNFIFFMVVTKFYVYRAEISDSIKVLEEELKEKTSNQVIPRD